MVNSDSSTVNQKLDTSNELQNHLKWLDTFTPAALGVLSTASGIYTYLGVSTLLDNTGILSVVAAVAYSTAVSVGIFVFWSYLLRLLPSMSTTKGYLGLSLAGVIGSCAIIAMSSWLNATALAGSAAVEQHLGKTIMEYQKGLERAHKISISAQSLKEEVKRSARTFEDLAEQEKDGDLSGRGGEGSIYAVLLQKRDELEEIQKTIEENDQKIRNYFKDGTELITKMQTFKSGSGPIDLRSLKFSEASIELSGIINGLLQSSQAAMVFRAMDDLESFIIPDLDGTGDFKETQADLIEDVKEKISNRAKVLREAAREIMEMDKPKDTVYTSISSADAVIIYAENFYPQWAGAIAIDLLPAILVFILAITQSVIRGGREGSFVEDRMTVSELKIAMRALKDVEKQKD